MTPFFEYIVKSSVSLAVFYIMFKATMSSLKMHGLNRLIMLGMLVISAILPLLNISLIPEKQGTAIPFHLMSDLWLPLDPIQPEVSPAKAILTEVKSEQIVRLKLPWHFCVYVLVLLTLLGYTLFSLASVLKIIRRSTQVRIKDLRISLVKERVDPFTFLNRVVMNRVDFKTNRDIIIAHEHAHIKLMHWADLVLIGLFTTIHWFNPFMWFLRRDLKLIHEYQADEAVLHTGIDAQKYQLLVLEKAVGKRRFALANQFNQKPIKKRFTMIQKKQPPKWVGLKFLFFVPLTALMLQAFSSPEAITAVVTDQISASEQTNETQWLELWNLENFLKSGPSGISIVDNKMQIQEVYVPTLEDYQNNPSLSNNASPPPPNEWPIKSRNVMVILINKDNRFLTEDEPSTYEETIQGVHNFLDGKPIFEGKEEAAEWSVISIPGQNDLKASKGVISVKYDRGTSTAFINQLLKDIGKKYLALRQQKSELLYNKDYFDLSNDERKVIEKVVPLRVFIAEPKKFGESQNTSLKPPPPPPPSPIKLFLMNNGDVYVNKYYIKPTEENGKWTSIDNKLVSLTEVKEYLIDRRKLRNETIRLEIIVQYGTPQEKIDELTSIIDLSSFKTFLTQFKPPPSN